MNDQNQTKNDAPEIQPMTVSELDVLQQITRDREVDELRAATIALGSLLMKVRQGLDGPEMQLSQLRIEIDHALNQDEVAIVLEEYDALKHRVEDLETKINSPELVNFLEGVKIEAAHQRDRWGTRHDDRKTMSDWIAVFIHLLGKLVNASWDGNMEKSLHHLITVAAVAGNAHARLVKLKADADAAAKTSPAG